MLRSPIKYTRRVENVASKDFQDSRPIFGCFSATKPSKVRNLAHDEILQSNILHLSYTA